MMVSYPVILQGGIDDKREVHVNDIVRIRGVEIRTDGSRFYSHLDLTVKLAETISDARLNGHAQLLVLLPRIYEGGHEEVKSYFESCAYMMELTGEKIETILNWDDPKHNEVVINFFCTPYEGE